MWNNLNTEQSKSNSQVWEAEDVIQALWAQSLQDSGEKQSTARQPLVAPTGLKGWTRAAIPDPGTSEYPGSWLFYCLHLTQVAAITMAIMMKMTADTLMMVFTTSQAPFYVPHISKLI